MVFKKKIGLDFSQLQLLLLCFITIFRVANYVVFHPKVKDMASIPVTLCSYRLKNDLFEKKTNE